MSALQTFKQETFNRAVRGLCAQGWQQAVESDTATCTWLIKAPDGRQLRCAIGHLVVIDESLSPWGDVDMLLGDPEEYFDPEIYPLYEAAAEVDRDEVAEWLTAMQTAHDNTMVGMQVMKDRFLSLGLQHGLTWPEESA